MADMFANRKVTNYIINHLEKNGLSAPVQRATQSDSHYITAKLPSEHHDALEGNGFDSDKTRKIRISDHANPSSHSDYSIRTDADEHKNYGWRTLANQVLNDFKPELYFISKLPKKPKTQTEPQQLALPQIGSKVSHRSFGAGTVVDHTPSGVSVSFNGNEQNIHPAYLSQISKADGGGITAYHGSPHDFDQFDTAKIGTGEGAQAYGHGLYFAEHEPVAKGYRDELSKGYLINGKLADYDDINHNAAIDISKYGSIEGAKKYHQDALDRVYDKWNLASEKERLQNPHAKIFFDELADIHNSILNRIKKHEQGDVLPQATPSGHMYEVHIDAHPDHFLDWDKPLSEQSEHVKNALSNVMKMHGKISPTSGGKAYQDLERIMNFVGKDSPKIESSQTLLDAGIHGIKYLDSGSRGNTDTPTRNYVVFDHNRVNVKRKYEQGGEVEEYGDGGHIPVGDPRRDENLTAFQKNNHPDVPHVGYHGTIGNFNKFSDKLKGSSTGAKSAEMGHWFTDTPRVAQSYAHYAATNVPVRKLVEAAEKAGRRQDWDAHDKYMTDAEEMEFNFRDPENEKRGQNIMPVHLSMKNPHVIDANGGDFNDLEGGLSKHIFYAKRKGHDGLIIKNLDDAAGIAHLPATHYMVFHPHQIKSATGNNGNFDPANPDITKAEGGVVRRAYKKGGKVEGAIWHERDANEDVNNLRNKIVNGRHAYSVDGGTPEAGSTGSADSNSYGGDSGYSGSSNSDNSPSESGLGPGMGGGNGNNSDPFGNGNNGGIGTPEGMGAFGDPSNRGGPLGFNANYGMQSPQEISGNLSTNTTPAGAAYLRDAMGTQMNNSNVAEGNSNQHNIAPTDTLNAGNWSPHINSAAAEAGYQAGLNAGIHPSQVGVGSADVYQMGQDMRPQAPLPDSAFGHTMIDPSGKYTGQALSNMNTATDAVTMLNDPGIMGSFVRAFSPTPTPATDAQQAQINSMYAGAYGDNSIPANFATLAPTPSLPHPGQTSDAYLGAGPSASIGRQDYGTSAPSAVGSGSPVDAYNQSSSSSPRSDFNNAFAAAAAAGQQNFSWTNPVTGQTQTYAVKFRKSGGRTLNSQIVQHALNKARASLPASSHPLTGNATGRRR